MRSSSACQARDAAPGAWSRAAAACSPRARHHALPAAGIWQYEQVPGPDAARAQCSVAALALHMFCEPEIQAVAEEWLAGQQAAGSGEGGGGAGAAGGASSEGQAAGAAGSEGQGGGAGAAAAGQVAGTGSQGAAVASQAAGCEGSSAADAAAAEGAGAAAGPAAPGAQARAGASKRPVKVPALSNRAEQKLVHSAIRMALQVRVGGPACA